MHSVILWRWMYSLLGNSTTSRLNDFRIHSAHLSSSGQLSTAISVQESASNSVLSYITVTPYLSRYSSSSFRTSFHSYNSETLANLDTPVYYTNRRIRPIFYDIQTRRVICIITLYHWRHCVRSISCDPTTLHTNENLWTPSVIVFCLFFQVFYSNRPKCSEA